MRSERILPVIIGPTCVGKTAFSIELALSCGAEIISCDSRQVYIGMDIGTAKTPYHLQQIVPHHLIDVVYPDEEFNAQIWSSYAEKSLAKIQERRRIPLIVCGTGLYLSALTDGFFSLPDLTKEKKNEIELKIKEIEKKSPIYEFLINIDKESALRIHPNDKYRIKRAIEIYLLTGEPASLHKKRTKQTKKEGICYIGLTMSRKELYRRINKRVDNMINDGFVEEVEFLLKCGYNETLKAFQAPGYRELIEFFKGSISLKSAISETKTKTRNYAKRQYTWFKKLRGVNWFNVSEGYTEIVKNAIDVFKKI